MSPSFEQLYREYRERVFAYISNRVNPREDAEDLCEEVFLKLRAALEKYDENRAAVSTLIYKMAHDKVIDYYRTHREGSELDEDSAILRSSEEIVMDKVLAAEVRNAVARLPIEQRDILLLRFYVGIPLKEIALKMGISYNTAVSRQKSALHACRRMLQGRI